MNQALFAREFARRSAPLLVGVNEKLSDYIVEKVLQEHHQYGMDAMMIEIECLRDRLLELFASMGLEDGAKS